MLEPQNQFLENWLLFFFKRFIWFLFKKKKEEKKNQASERVCGNQVI